MSLNCKRVLHGVVAATVLAGALLGDALAVNCTQKCKLISAVEFQTGGGTWKCRYIVEDAGEICAGKNGHQTSVYTNAGLTNNKCADESGSAQGDVKYKECQGADTCSTQCTGQDSNDHVEATKENDGTSCGGTTNSVKKNCVVDGSP